MCAARILLTCIGLRNVTLLTNVAIVGLFERCIVVVFVAALIRCTTILLRIPLQKPVLTILTMWVNTICELLIGVGERLRLGDGGGNEVVVGMS